MAVFSYFVLLCELSGPPWCTSYVYSTVTSHGVFTDLCSKWNAYSTTVHVLTCLLLISPSLGNVVLTYFTRIWIFVLMNTNWTCTIQYLCITAAVNPLCPEWTEAGVRFCYCTCQQNGNWQLTRRYACTYCNKVWWGLKRLVFRCSIPAICCIFCRTHFTAISLKGLLAPAEQPLQLDSIVFLTFGYNISEYITRTRYCVH